MPSHKRHFGRGWLQLLTGSTYRRAKLLRVIGSPDFSLVCGPQSCALRQPACVAGSAVKYHADFSLFVGFDEIEVVKNEPVLKVLDYFSDIVGHILLSIEGESKRLGLVK
ncbi:MAG: hypothetical protein ABSA59_18610 [Terriglobia bacterium]|jgi:hypothetical protein